MLFKYHTMYTLQYWNGKAAEWRNAGFRSADYEAVLRALRDNQRMTDYCVRFRILLPSADPLSGLTDKEYQRATTPV